MTKLGRKREHIRLSLGQTPQDFSELLAEKYVTFYVPVVTSPKDSCQAVIFYLKFKSSCGTTWDRKKNMLSQVEGRHLS